MKVLSAYMPRRMASALVLSQKFRSGPVLNSNYRSDVHEVYTSLQCPDTSDVKRSLSSFPENIFGEVPFFQSSLPPFSVIHVTGRAEVRNTLRILCKKLAASLEDSGITP